MKLVIPHAIAAQIALLPATRRTKLQRELQRMAEHFNGSQSPDVKPSASDPSVWTLRLSDGMRALARTDASTLTVLALASIDQLVPYLSPKGQHAA